MTKRAKMGFLAQSAKKSTQSTPSSARVDPFDGKEYRLLSNFGADKRQIFNSKEDFDRFEAYLYLLNSMESPRVANLFADNRQKNIFETGRGEKLIAIGAYSFTPRRFQILATPLVDGGIGKFMQKLQTAYTMYFNKKYAHTGRLLYAKYESDRAQTEAELKYMFAFVHLAPSELFNENWESVSSFDVSALAVNALGYRYSSMGEYLSSKPIITTPTEFPRSIVAAKKADALVRFWLAHQQKRFI